MCKCIGRTTAVANNKNVGKFGESFSQSKTYDTIKDSIFFVEPKRFIAFEYALKSFQQILGFLDFIGRALTGAKKKPKTFESAS